MKRRTVMMGVISLATALLLGGCDSRAGTYQNDNGEGNRSEVTSFELLNEAEQLAWEDNSLDELHAVINLPLKRFKEEGDLEGGSGRVVLGEAGCVRFKNHLKSNYADAWSGVNGITTNGDEFSLKIELEPELKGLQVHLIGPISGGKGYVACREVWDDEGVSEYWIYELDDEFQKVRGLQATLDARESLTELAGDVYGNFHATYRRKNGKIEYVVISSEGSVIFEQTFDHQFSLCMYGNGRVAACESMTGSYFDFRFYEADYEKGMLRELAVSKDETVRKRMKNMSNVVFVATPVDEYRLVWGAQDGLYEYNLREGKETLLYEWSNHGIDDPFSVFDVIVTGGGTIGLVRFEGDGQNYVLLTTTEKKGEVETITLAASPQNANYYRRAAANFNRKYPAYNVIVRCDYDETGLLTRLGAGDGPVLVDTALTGFEELEELWQPLDGFLEQTGLVDEMIPNALDFGKIGNVTYGLTTSFRIQTLVTTDPKLSGWNYEEFLIAMEERDGAPLTNKYLYNPTDMRGDFFDMLRNGLDDTFYLDVESGMTIFGTESFDRVLRIAEKANKCPSWEDGRSLLEGDAICEACTILFLQDAIVLRRRLEATGEYVAGYPTKDGGKNLLVAESPIAMRRTASEEEKKIAYTFLKVMFSGEVMKAMSVSGFGVRWDILDQAFADYETSVGIDKRSGLYDPTSSPELEEGDREFLMELISDGTAKKSFPSALEKVFDEEFSAYLKGGIDGKTLSEHLKSRVWLYLEESK